LVVQERCDDPVSFEYLEKLSTILGGSYPQVGRRSGVGGVWLWIRLWITLHEINLDIIAEGA
jgi:hypothetical protein